jgi:hypothetical protein
MGTESAGGDLMTLEEKRNFCEEFCDSQEDCGCCKLADDKNNWCQEYNIRNAPEEVLDYSIRKIQEDEVCISKKAMEVEKMLHSMEEDIINHPNHYNRDGAMESIDEMVLVFGKEAVKNFCLCNVWKYRYRSADKNGIEDLKKSDWYMRKYKELSANA